MAIVRGEHDVIVARVIQYPLPCDGAASRCEHVFDGEELVDLVHRGVGTLQYFTIASRRLPLLIRSSVQLFCGTRGQRHVYSERIVLQLQCESPAYLSKRSG